MSADQETRKEEERKKAYLQKYIAAGLTRKSMQCEIDELHREQADYERMEEIIRQMRKQIGLSPESEKAPLGQSAAIAGYEQRLHWKQAEAAALQQEIAGKIRAVADERYRTLLWLRYVVGLTWEVIALRMSYNPRYVIYKLHRQALEAFEC